MQLGIFAKTFARGTFAETLDAVSPHGLRCIQFNFSCAGLPPLPDRIAPEILQEVRNECRARSIRIAGVSGTFNMIHPEVAKRRESSRRFGEVVRATSELGCNLVSLCTGTRDPVDMWREHPENDSAEAWRDLLETLEATLRMAEPHDVLLGIEPEVGNVVNSARKARHLLDEMKSRRLKVIIDPANLFRSADILSGSLAQPTRGQDVRAPLTWMRDTIDNAFHLLGPDIIMAHAKELALDGSMGQLAPGQGILDWDFYLDSLRRIGFDGPLIMHGVAEDRVGAGTEFLRRKLGEERGHSVRESSRRVETRGQDVRAPET